jgi:hypothetical protein
MITYLHSKPVCPPVNDTIRAWEWEYIFLSIYRHIYRYTFLSNVNAASGDLVVLRAALTSSSSINARYILINHWVINWDDNVIYGNYK